jgi:DNA phosphorothioation-dependent restriction protein DptG
LEQKYFTSDFLQQIRANSIKEDFAILHGWAGRIYAHQCQNFATWALIMIRRANQRLRPDSRNFKMWQDYQEVISLKEEYRCHKHEPRLKSSDIESWRPYRAKEANSKRKWRRGTEIFRREEFPDF